MSKTARDVLKAQFVGPSPGWSLDDAEVDALITDLDAAGFVIVPKEAIALEIVRGTGHQISLDEVRFIIRAAMAKEKQDY